MPITKIGSRHAQLTIGLLCRSEQLHKTRYKSRKEKQNGFLALFRQTLPRGRDLPAHLGHGTHSPVLGVHRPPLLRAKLRRHVVHPKRAGLPGASGGLAVADPAAVTLPEHCAMGSSSLRSTDDRALDN